MCAILNDTTGTLMSCAWKNNNCRIGLIVGTSMLYLTLDSIESAGIEFEFQILYFLSYFNFHSVFSIFRYRHQRLLRGENQKPAVRYSR